SQCLICKRAEYSRDAAPDGGIAPIQRQFLRGVADQQGHAGGLAILQQVTGWACYDPAVGDRLKKQKAVVCKPRRLEQHLGIEQLASVGCTQSRDLGFILRYAGSLRE